MGWHQPFIARNKNSVAIRWLNSFRSAWNSFSTRRVRCFIPISDGKHGEMGNKSDKKVGARATIHTCTLWLACHIPGGDVNGFNVQTPTSLAVRSTSERGARSAMECSQRENKLIVEQGCYIHACDREPSSMSQLPCLDHSLIHLPSLSATDSFILRRSCVPFLF
jgi:hypothetical protein